MKIKLLLYTLIIMIGCKAQNNNKRMETFDKIQFDKNKVNGEYNFVLNDGKLVRQMENPKRGEYTEVISDPAKPYSTVNVFFMASGRLKIKGFKFYDMPIHTWKYYDENGGQVKETNWDTPFKLSIDEVARIMKAMNVDIMNRHNGVEVDRMDDPHPKYVVAYPVGKERPYDINSVYIDGITGKILEKTVSSVKH